MGISIITTLTSSLLTIPTRLQKTVNAYLFSLMLITDKRSQTFAESVTGVDQSSFSWLLRKHGQLAETCLQELIRQFVKELSHKRPPLVAGANWTVAIIIDATLHQRSSLYPQNVQRFNHGQGFVIGHQWTNITLYLNGQLVPLPPIAFFSKKECKRRNITYRTEHQCIAEYLETLNLAKLIGLHCPDEVVVIMDSGYDSKQLQQLVVDQGWDFVSALKKRRFATTVGQRETGIKGRQVDELFLRSKKQSPWKTIRIKADGGKKRRRFRTRKLCGYLRGVSIEVALICSEKSGKIKGRRFFACSKANLNAGVIMRAYALRWTVEMFHKTIKKQLGLEQAGVHAFDTLRSHVHWVYCAWILLHKLEMSNSTCLLEKQRRLTEIAHQSPIGEKIKKIISAKNQFGGSERQQTLLNEALQAVCAF